MASRASRAFSFVENTSLRGLAGSCALAGAGVVVSGLVMRQRMLREHPICQTACDQLERSEEVRRWLGAGEVSTGGVVGGYVDIQEGTAAFRIPLGRSADGGAAYARVEAEAEWLRVPGAASASGPPVEERASARWLLRHLELEPPQGGGGGHGGQPPLVLYSLEASVPESKWAPSREPSAIPSAVRNLLPNTQALLGDSEAHRFVLTLATAVMANAVAFTYLHRRARGLERVGRVLELLRLPVDRPAAKLRAAAMRVAERSIEARALQPKQEGGGLYGWQAADTLYALAPVVSPAAAYDLLLAARRDGNGEWELTHVSLAEPAETQVRLTRGGLATGDSLAIAQAAVAEMIGAAESLPLAPSTRGAGRGGERSRRRA
mmetsp:Transcript_41918/g.134759  ORF Transcript_41918/g.134759 Transcript_41918/m.134759 type:complete len:378 (+) Transcript_41918:101-1234(+)